MPDIIEGFNSATKVYPLRSQAIAAAISALKEETHRCEEAPAYIVVAIPLGEGITTVGYNTSPEVYSIHYTECRQGEGWVYDAIP